MTVCGEKVTGFCVAGKCPYFKRCHPVVWDKYGKIKPKTNEEWFCSLTTEEKARFLAKKCCEISCKFFLGEAEEIFSKYWVEWLKQPHR